MSRRSAGIWLFALLVALACGSAAAAPPTVDFEKQIAPILLRRCVGCHNTSDAKGSLDLTNRAALLAGGDSGAAITVGKLGESLLLQRVVDGEMPPEEKGQPLSQQEVALLRNWIAAGAAWPKERVLSPFELTTDERAGRDWWSMQQVVKPTVPVTGDFGWVENPIDAFVLSKLQEHQLQPAPPADRVTLLRRAKFDLLGLPPTPAEIDAFLADKSPDAYGRLIDRLLASPQYGERWGRHWLDVVRYTESDGFEHDKMRPHAWRYRDYVIGSLNADKAYDRFVVEQLAGDALPQPTRDGIVATGFLVAGPWDEVQNVGASKSEMRRAHEEQMAELIGAVSQTFLGVTVGCARCHDHKFDPVSQSDYYGIKAVFDGVNHSRGRTVGNQPILTPAEMAAHRKRIDPLEGAKKQLAAELAKLNEQFSGDAIVEKADPQTLTDGRFGKALHAKRKQAKTKSKTAYHTPPLTVECWVRADSKTAFNVFVANNLKESGEHWELYSFAGKGDFSVYMPGYQPATIRSDVVITDGKWHYLAMQFDGKLVKMYVDGKPVKEQAVKRVRPPGAVGELYFGGYTPQKIGCDGAVDEVRISNAIRPVNVVPDKPLEADKETVGLWRFDQIDDGRIVDHAPSSETPDKRQLAAKRAALTKELKQVEQQLAVEALPLAYIGFRSQPPPTHVLLRGDIKTPGELATPCGLTTIRVPSSHFGLNEKTPEGQRRLRFARWVTDGKNPLTARVMVNRLWQYHFGRGLVEKPSDFGFQGGRPSHEQLLDYLAAEFVESGWSIKRMHRSMMLSATYRQSSRFDARAAKVDSENRLLWRYRPRRLEGEAVRDAMLAVSGDLNRRMGGPSYRPFTVTVFNTHFYHLFDSDKPEFNRRTVYRANIITGRDPLLDSLDCPAPSVGAPRRRTTVTPLQALSLMNDSFVLRQAERFAASVKQVVGDDTERQARLVFRSTLAREPRKEELATTIKLINEHDLKSACWVLLNSSEFLYVQ